MGKHSREAEFIENLIHQLGNKYIRYESNVPYSNGRACGEIDLMAYRRDGLVDLYEVKTSQRGIRRARSQLHRAEQNLHKIGNTFIYIGLEDKIMLP